MKSKLSTIAKDNLWIGNMSAKQIDYHGPLIIDKSSGIYMFDISGNKYIDAMAGAWVVNAGHGRTEIIDAMTQQASRLPFVLNEGYTNETTLELCERLLSLASSGGYDKVFFASGGSEAVETALKMVRQFWASTGKPRHKVIGRQLSYHGATWGAMSVTGFPDWKWPFSPPVAGASFISHPTCIRCPLGLTYSNCATECASGLKDAIEKAGPDKVGAVIAEPISAASAAHVPPSSYWKIIRDICDEYGIPLIADEIVTGFGRTGKWFGLDNWNVSADILVVGKGLTSGYFPMSAVLTRPEFTERMEFDGFVHGYTFSGHPIGCSAALANLDIIQRENLVGNAYLRGMQLSEQLSNELANCSIVGDVRGKGLLMSVEIVRDRSTMKRFSDPFELAAVSKPIFMKNGVLCRVGGQIRLGPPLSISESETSLLGELLIASICELESEVVKRRMK